MNSFTFVYQYVSHHNTEISKHLSINCQTYFIRKPFVYYGCILKPPWSEERIKQSNNFISTLNIPLSTIQAEGMMN